jgi:hypothetical protein
MLLGKNSPKFDKFICRHAFKSWMVDWVAACIQRNNVDVGQKTRGMITMKSNHGMAILPITGIFVEKDRMYRKNLINYCICGGLSTQFYKSLYLEKVIIVILWVIVFWGGLLKQFCELLYWKRTFLNLCRIILLMIQKPFGCAEFSIVFSLTHISIRKILFCEITIKLLYILERFF